MGSCCSGLNKVLKLTGRPCTKRIQGCSVNSPGLQALRVPILPQSPLDLGQVTQSGYFHIDETKDANDGPGVEHAVGCGEPE